MCTFTKSFIIIRSGILGTKDQPICHSPTPSDNEAELNYFIKYHVPPELHKKRRRKTIKRIPDELGKNNFRRLIELRKSFKNSEKVITRMERKEAIELRRKINLYMLTPNEKKVLQNLKMLRWFFIKKRFKYYKKKHTNRIKWRTMPIYSLKKNSPFTHDEIVIMCVGNGTLHYIGKLTRKEILLLTETAEEYYKNGLLNIDKDKVYILETVIPLIQAITTLRINVKMELLNSKKYGKRFLDTCDQLVQEANKAMLRDRNIDVTCEHCRCLTQKIITKGEYKSHPYTFTDYLEHQMTDTETTMSFESGSIEVSDEEEEEIAPLRDRIINNFTFKMWEYNELGSYLSQRVPTRDLTKLNTIPGALYFNTSNTPYGVPQFAPISFYRVVQYAIAAVKLQIQSSHKLWHSNSLITVINLLKKHISLDPAKFVSSLSAEVVNKSIAFIIKYKNAFRKMTKDNKTVEQIKKVKFRVKRLGRKYSLLARTVNKRLQVRLANHPGFRKELLAYNQRITTKRNIYSTRRKVKRNKTPSCQNPLYDEEYISPMLLYKNGIDAIQNKPNEFHSVQDAIVRRYKTLIHELKEIQQLMKPKTLAKKRKNKKRKCYFMIRSIYQNVKLGKINSHRITKSMNVWLQFGAHIRNLIDDFNDSIEKLMDFKMSNWLPREKTVHKSKFLFKFEKTEPKVEPERLNECTYNKKLRVLVNNKQKKILGGYRSLKLGTDWTSKYHEIIQRKFIKVDHFRQQKDSYVIQAGKMAAKGCEKVVKKCLYAFRLFGFEKKDLELALLVYAKLRIMVKMELTVRYPNQDKLLEEDTFLDTKTGIYNDAKDQHFENITKIKAQFISWRKLNNNFKNKVLVENCVNPKHSIEKFFYGLDLRHINSRKSLEENELFDLNDYKYYDYKSDEDFSNKLDYSSDSSCKIKKDCTIDFCVCEEGESYVNNHTDDKNQNSRRISKEINLKELILPNSTNSKEHTISIIQNHLTSFNQSQSGFVNDESIISCPDLYINSNNLHRNSESFILKNIHQHKHKDSYEIIVSSDNDSSSTSYATKMVKSYFQDRIKQEANVDDITESDLRIQSRRKEKREKFSLRLKLGGELYWRKTPNKLIDTFEKYLNSKFSFVRFMCRNFTQHVVPEYRSVYYFEDFPELKESEDIPLVLSAIAYFPQYSFKNVHGTQRYPHKRIFVYPEIDSIESDSYISFSGESDSEENGSDSEENGSDSEENGSIEKLKSDSVLDYEKFLKYDTRNTKYDNIYQKLKGYDYLKLKEEIRHEIENFEQMLRYEKKCLVQDYHSNDVLMEIANRAEEKYPMENSILSKRNYFPKQRFDAHKCGQISFDPNEWAEYFNWIKTLENQK